MRSSSYRPSSVHSLATAEMTEQPPYLVQQGDAQMAVVRALFEHLPGQEWRSCVFQYRSTVSMAESVLTVTDNAGSSQVVESSIGMILAFKRLRELMASQGRGAWFSAVLTATAEGKCTFDFNYDARPDWTVNPSAESYIADLEKFPRPAELVPDWYPRG